MAILKLITPNNGQTSGKLTNKPKIRLAAGLFSNAKLCTISCKELEIGQENRMPTVKPAKMTKGAGQSRTW
uniref:Uncharacterized protein n=1 Tax=Romanomermis culicivorax TaxID=13658 RepID=A0A915IQC2_ROMCU